MSVLLQMLEGGGMSESAAAGTAAFGLQCKAMGEEGKNFMNRFAVDWSGCGCRAVASIAKRARFQHRQCWNHCPVVSVWGARV